MSDYVVADGVCFEALYMTWGQGSSLHGLWRWGGREGLALPGRPRIDIFFNNLGKARLLPAAKQMTEP